MRVLGIETSCDETGLALYDSQLGLIGQTLYSQIELHAQYGGVVPELASRDHIRKMIPLLDELLAQTNTTKQQIDAIAYTKGPGLMGALMVGALFGRSLAYALNVPAIGVHHMEGHLLAPMLSAQQPQFPFVALLVSGGHTQLMLVKAMGQYELLGESIDDAAGEAFDKVAKMMGLPYPGGVHIAKLAQSGNPKAFHFPRPMLGQGLQFSFSGLKTSVLTQYNKLKDTFNDDLAQADVTRGAKTGVENHLNESKQYQPNQLQQFKADIAASFQAAIIETLVKKCVAALKQCQVKQLVIAGGVSANIQLRQQLEQALAKMHAQVFYAEPHLCTDNGAMIAYAGWCRLSAGQSDGMAVSLMPRWPMVDLPPLKA